MHAAMRIARMTLTATALIAFLTTATLLIVSGHSSGADDTLPPAPDRQVDFESDVRPIFQQHCERCHGPRQQKGGLRLDLRAAAMRGGDNFAPVIVAGKADQSPLVRLIAGLEEGMEMPAEGDRLSDVQIGVIRGWIDQGALWPDRAAGDDARTTHWAFQPANRPTMPDAVIPEFANGAIDRFIESTLAKNGLSPSTPSDRGTLLRRLKFDLLGLPPTPEELEAFVSDPRPDAYEVWVDRFLASPHLGERWARHWLDVVRFAESDGFETNQPRPNAWPYRDYVVGAFSGACSFEPFIFEQLAGDTVGVDEATGFLVGGPYDRVKSPDIVLTLQQRADELHDMVSTTGSAFLGLTIGCARCHNH